MNNENNSAIIAKYSRYLSPATLLLAIITLIASFAGASLWACILLGIAVLVLAAIGIYRHLGPLNIASVVIGLVAIAIACFHPHDRDGGSLIFNQIIKPTPSGPTVTTPVKTNDLKLEKFELVAAPDSSSTATVVGDIKNNSRQTLPMPVVSFSAYDQSGNEIPGSCLDVKSTSIAPGEVWEFIAVCPADSTPARVQIRAIEYTSEQPVE